MLGPQPRKEAFKVLQGAKLITAWCTMPEK